jgi:hypothetical protein
MGSKVESAQKKEEDAKDNIEDDLSFWKVYPREVMEAFIIILVVQGIMDRSINIYQVLKIACVIGLITFIAIDVIDADFNKSIKDGLRNNLGYFMFAAVAV